MSVHFILHSRTTMSPKTLNTSEFSILTAFFGGSSAMTCHQLSSFITGGLWWIDLQSDFDGFLQFHQVVKPWNPTIPIPSCSPPLLLFSVQKCLQGVHFRGQVSRSTTWMMHGWSSGFCSNGSQPWIVHGKTEKIPQGESYPQSRPHGLLKSPHSQSPSFAHSPRNCCNALGGSAGPSELRAAAGAARHAATLLWTYSLGQKQWTGKFEVNIDTMYVYIGD